MTPTAAGPHSAPGNNRGRSGISDDANGSRVSEPDRQYHYDTAGRLTTYTGSGHTARYQYNGLGERVAKTVDGVITYFVYDEQGHLIGEYDAAATATRETVYLGDLPMLVLGGGATYYVHADWRNAPRQLDNGQQQAVWAWDPAPFGDRAPNSNPQNLSTSFTWNARFPGQYWDDESRLLYNYQRTYDPAIGRYLESDPIGLDGGINTYAYASESPILLIDPAGLMGRGSGGGRVPGTQHSVRIDPAHVTGQQRYAHIYDNKGNEVPAVSKDGSPSHGSCPAKDLPKNKKLLDFLRSKGFALGIAFDLLLLHDLAQAVGQQTDPYNPFFMTTPTTCQTPMEI